MEESGFIKETQDYFNCSREKAILILILASPIIWPIIIILILHQIPLMIAYLIISLFGEKKRLILIGN